MTWTRVTLAAQARVFAKDNSSTPATDNTTVYALLTDIYARYDHAFLRERVRLISTTFVTIPNGAYASPSTVTAIDLVSLEKTDGAGQVSHPFGPLERDDYYAVVADSEGCANLGANSQIPLRWGAIKLQDGNNGAGTLIPGQWQVAVFPPNRTGSGIALAAWGHVAATPLSADGTVADLEDIDALSIARLLAAEIMWNNGDDPTAIQAVLGPLDTTIKQKFAYLAQRQPRRLPETKEP